MIDARLCRPEVRIAPSMLGLDDEADAENDRVDPTSIVCRPTLKHLVRYVI